MAIPTSLFRTKFGIAVMRYDFTLNEWFFECWATRQALVRDLPAGGHRFALWLIIGDTSGASYITQDGWSSIYVMRARR